MTKTAGSLVTMKIPRLRVAGALAALACAGGVALPAAAQSSSLPTLSVAITSSSATISGALQSGAVNVVSTDAGVKEAAVIIFRQNPGVSTAEIEAFSKSKKESDPNNADKYGSIVLDLEDNPGATSQAQTYLQPGQYIELTAAGEKQAQIEAHFTIAAAVSPVALPKPEATVRTIEFAFRGPTTLKDGELVRFENEGFLVHMDAAFPVKNMKDAQKVVKALKSGKEKGLEKLVAGAPVTFAGPLSPGSYQQETISAKPGIYVQACFMATQDGRSHTLLGMERIFKITK
jgi:uncharacterized cupredoxin-like copper-binding protein